MNKIIKKIKAAGIWMASIAILPSLKKANDTMIAAAAIIRPKEPAFNPYNTSIKTREQEKR